MATEIVTSICDTPPVAELVDCVPPPEVLSVDVSSVPPETPTDQTRDATIEQTGADPPPLNG